MGHQVNKVGVFISLDKIVIFLELVSVILIPWEQNHSSGNFGICWGRMFLDALKLCWWLQLDQQCHRGRGGAVWSVVFVHIPEDTVKSVFSCNSEISSEKIGSLLYFSGWNVACLVIQLIYLPQGFPCGSDGKASAYTAGDRGSSPGSGRSSGEGNGNPLQYSCLENPMDGGAR